MAIDRWTGGVKMINLIAREDEKVVVVCTASRYLTDNAQDLRDRGYQIDPMPVAVSPCPNHLAHKHYAYRKINVPQYAWDDQMRAMRSTEGRAPKEETNG